MQGPITVFDGGSYAGDAQITDMAPGAEQLVTFALDLDTEVAPSPGASPVNLVSVKISKGVFAATNKAQREMDYLVQNRGTKAKTVLIEHPLQADWTLDTPKQPLEKTRDSYRFAVPMAAGKSATLAVIETKMISQTVALSNMGSDQVAVYISSPVVSLAVKTALQKVVALQAAVTDTVTKRSTRESRVNDINNDQSRIRQNMDRLAQTSDLYKQYVKTLTDEETELATLRADVARLRDQEASQRRDLGTFIQNLDVGSGRVRGGPPVVADGHGAPEGPPDEEEPAHTFNEGLAQESLATGADAEPERGREGKDSPGKRRLGRADLDGRPAHRVDPRGARDLHTAFLCEREVVGNTAAPQDLLCLALGRCRHRGLHRGSNGLSHRGRGPCFRDRWFWRSFAVVSSVLWRAEITSIVMVPSGRPVSRYWVRQLSWAAPLGSTTSRRKLAAASWMSLNLRGSESRPGVDVGVERALGRLPRIVSLSAIGFSSIELRAEHITRHGLKASRLNEWASEGTWHRGTRNRPYRRSSTVRVWRVYTAGHDESISLRHRSQSRRAARTPRRA